MIASGQRWSFGNDTAMGSLPFTTRALLGSGSYGNSLAGKLRLVYIYLFPVALIAALYNGRLAVLSTAAAMVCADYFLQEPLYSFANDNPLEYGDLICFALLAVTAIKVVRVLRPRRPAVQARDKPERRTHSQVQAS